MPERQVRVDIVGDNASLKRALSDSERSLTSLDKTSQATSKSMQRMEGAFGTAAKLTAAVFAVDAFAQGLMSVVNAGARLEQSQGAMQAVFKDQAGSMQAAAEAAVAIGISQAEYGEIASRLGAQLKNLGTEQEDVAGQTQRLIAVGGDLAATFGGTTTQAVEALSSAFRGEFDPIEKYGITLTATGVNAIMAAEDMSKAEAITSLVLKQSADAFGQAAREYDTTAARMQRAQAATQNAQAQIGMALGSLAGAAAGAIEGVASLVAKYPDFFAQSAVAVAAYSGSLRGLTAITDRYMASSTAAVDMWTRSISQIQQSRWGMDQYGNSLSTAQAGLARAQASQSRWQTVAAKGPAVLAGVTIGLELLSLTLSYVNAELTEGATSVEEFAAGLDNLDPERVTETVEAMSGAADAAESLARWGQPISVLGGDMQSFGRAWAWWVGSIVPGIAKGKEEVENFNTAMREQMALDPTSGAAATIDAYRRMREEGMDAQTAADLFGETLTQAQGIQEEYGASAVSTAGQVDALTGSFEEATDRASAFSDSMKALFTELDVEVALEQWKAALDEFSKSARDGLDPSELRSYADEWIAVSDAMIAGGAGTEAVMAKWEDMRETTRRALADVGVRGKEAQRILDDTFRTRHEVKVMVGDATDNIRDLAKQVGGMPELHKIVFEALTTKAADRTDAQKKLLESVPREWQTKFSADPSDTVAAAGQAETAVQDVPSSWTTTLRLAVEAVSGAAQKAWDFVFGRSALPPEDVVSALPAGRAVLDPFAASGGSGGSGGKGDAYRTITVAVVFDAELEEFTNAFRNLNAYINRMREDVQQLGSLLDARRAALKEQDRADNADERKAAASELRDVMRDIHHLGYRNAQAAADALKSDRKRLANAEQAMRIAERQSRLLEKRRSDLEAMRDMAEGFAEQLNAVDVGAAYGALMDPDEIERGLAEAWNPALKAYWRKKAAENTLGKALADQVRSTESFVSNIEQLQPKLSPAALAEIVAQGAEAGNEIAEQLLADPALLRAYQSGFIEMEKLTRDLGVDLAGTTEKGVYQGSYAGLVAAIEDAYRTVKLKVDLPKQVRQDVHVTVQGVLVDPEGTARAIEKVMKDSKGRKGKPAWQ
jgi:hypothetical protein